MAAADERCWRVGELASATGLTVRALHHYDELGLLVPARRTAAGHRLYADGDVLRLYRIVALRGLGLPLDEIAAVLDRGEPGLAEIVRRQLGRVQSELDRHRRLRDRLGVVLATLERSGGEPSAGQFIDAMEEMTVITDVTEVARILGVSRQAAAELAESAADFPAPEAERHGRPAWARREVEAWAAGHPVRGPGWSRPETGGAARGLAGTRDLFELAARQSDQLDHGWIGDEHLLLALLDPDCPGAARAALESSGLTREAVRGGVLEGVGDAAPARPGWKPLSPGTQHVLDRAKLKAIELRDEEVGGEHALLALLEAAADSPALAVLSALGADRRAIARRAVALTDRGPTRPGPAADRPPGDEVHAAEVARILGTSRAGVAELCGSAPGFLGARVGPEGYLLWPRAAVESSAAQRPDRGPRRSRLRPPAPGQVGRGTDRILAIAEAEARALNHGWVGADHLILALLRPDCPGEAGAVLGSLGVELEQVRDYYVESMGDPYEPTGDDPVVPPGTQRLLELAALAALELEDEEVTSSHLLVAFVGDWGGAGLTLRRELPEAVVLHERLMAQTGGTLPVPRPTPPRPDPPRSARRMPPPPEPELAPSPLGHDPRRRRPWGSGVFSTEDGQTFWQGSALRQYRVDRDGYPVLTVEGEPIHSLLDEHGRYVLDEHGNHIDAVAAVPPGAQVCAYPKE